MTNMTTPIAFSRACRIALVLSALAATPLALVGTTHRDQAMAQTRAAAPDFAMAGQQDAYRSVAEEFVAAAARGDKMKTARMLSPATAAKAGADGVDRFLAGEVLPFFAPFQEFARSVSVTRTADAPGFAFYMYMVEKTGEMRPFVIYVIEEGGARVVANVLVDMFVEGRHCLKVAAGWKCPDFG
jgi:hypothetical protein